MARARIAWSLITLWMCQPTAGSSWARFEEPANFRPPGAFRVAVSGAQPAAKRAVATLLEQLRSTDWSVRADAYRQLSGDPGAMRSKAVKAAMIELVDRENHHRDANGVDGDRRYFDYVDALVRTADEVVAWDNPRQLCSLAHSDLKTDMAFAKALGRVGTPMLPCLLDMTASDGFRDRMVAAVALVQLRASTRSLDGATIQQIKSSMIRLLHDPEEGVRYWAIEAQDKLGTPDMIPALQDVADHEPAPEGKAPSIRSRAVDAIKEIQTSLSDRLKQLQAAEIDVRANAFEHLRARPETLARRDVRRALLELLDRENRVLESTLRDSNEQDGVGEGAGEYMGEVGETVGRFADWNDQRQVCIFVREAYSPESVFAAEIARHGQVAANCLIEMYKTSDVGLVRASAAPVLAQMLWGARRSRLDAGATSAARAIVLEALRDPNESVRSDIVRALGTYANRDMIPALRSVAESDPAFSSLTNAYWIRKYAVKAMADIEQRTRERAR
jgi:HEAT repeat protein